MAQIGYIRVSTDEQATSGLGLEAQIAAIHAVCPSASIYADEGVSSTKLDRKGLYEALQALSEGDELVVAKRDRLARDPMHMGWIELECRKRGARVVSIAGEGTENDDPTSILMRDIIDAFARFERLQIGARTKAALAAKTERGEKTGGTVPYGWDADADGRLTPNESEQAVLEAIEDLRDRGWSLRAICAEMEARGIKTKTGKTTWQPKVISRLLKVAA